MKKFVFLLCLLVPGFFTSVRADLPIDKLPVPPVIQPIVGQEGQWLSVILPTFSGGGSVYLDYTLRRFSGSPHNDPGASMPAGISFNPSLRNLYGWPKKAGKYTFTYAAKARSGNVGMVTFTLIIKPNLMPVAPSVGPQEVKAGQSFSIQLPEFTDPENTSLTYKCGFMAVEGGGNLIQPSWIVFDPSTRKLVGIPPANWYVDQRVMGIYEATDEQGKRNSIWFGLVVKPQTGNPPVHFRHPYGPKITPQYGKEGIPVTLQLPKFTDPQNKPLTYSLINANDDAPYGQMPNGLSFDPATRKITGVPAQAGVYKMQYKGEDANQQGVSVCFSLVVEANAMPVAPALQSQVLEPGKPFQFQLPRFTDPENDPMMSFLGLGLGVSSTTDFFPSWMHVDLNTRTVSGTPPPYEESFLLSYRARDALNESAVQFKVTVRKNNPPKAPVVKNLTYQVNKPMEVHLPVFIDPESDPVTLTLVGANYQLPEGLSFKPGDRKLYGTPKKTGVSTLHYIGKDSKGLLSSVSFTFTVTASAPPATSNARIAGESAETPREWTAVVLGNPVVGDDVDVEITDAQGQALRFELTDLNGRLISGQSRDMQQASERIRLPFSTQSAGLYVLKIAGRNQIKTLKVVK
ncbi:putative Ig domain-containing protein [Larkinella insperata]|uniref:Ig domain-containing protein n=1 Tax=Larkinella insperata TaxID=332158 RepID=A0ABW3QK93_9BACT|nr:putative Ig domain-containing protein [Larkinella insperata]